MCFGLPTGDRYGPGTVASSLQGVLQTLGVSSQLEFLYSVYEESSGTQVINYHGHAANRDCHEGSFIDFDDIPWEQLRDEPLRIMLQRYVREHQQEAFGLYVGDDQSGDVRGSSKNLNIDLPRINKERNAMKFSLFAHMERFDASVSHQESLADLVELVQLAEAGGFETVWVGEHHGMEFTIAPNPFLYLTYLAAHTSKIRLGTGTVVAPFWHPIKLADEAAITDLMTGGRLDIGIARGAYQFEYDRLGNGMDGLVASEMLREIIPAVKGLWEGDYEHSGKYWSFPSTSCIPGPQQQPHPPMWLAARDITSHQFAIEQGCNVMVTPLWNPDSEVDSLIEKFNTACAENPQIPRPQICLLRHSFVGENEAQVERGAQAMSQYYCYFGAWFQNKRPISKGFIQPLQ